MSDRSGRVLAIDTATSAVVTGVVEFAGADVTAIDTLAERVVTDQRRHAEVLTTLMREVLDESGTAPTDLRAVVVGCGPGPFTGLRVGMATGAAYADALGLPAYGVGTLDAINDAADTAAAETAERAGTGIRRLVLTDARRREVYWALYEGVEQIIGPEVSAPDSLVGRLAERPPETVIGESRFAERFGARGVDLVAPTSASLVRCAGDRIVARADAAPLTPLYLRRPDAVELKDQKRKALLPPPPERPAP
ncbi:tRNA (adenosine(37)-N6)-threonylcarbamoyltransferase complex dimerization subunit type 1 TsaB [Gordonia shandongensis]|uniref:tRNA (adenosine(37)-N6)-threonylcarbamoyltransferase complex dimerization subunit type 1 TsaB n=1 Tax=Gordonia shandongensis TaxID=376351 RepID=UPI000554DDD4|nr:tRNA (adenosine(37)-N6)-threonylcarbamoyltransferase complex dimerization subunit type 1 TsaB [Gordonia shandongensis]